ncbi:MAG: tetratricopeptide repeat protein, partial [Candidatus Hydrogenedentes bacterium]|nr:tetratricopeptide repeat protein [Candidatus Hydrogenedentota bacterium]
ANDPARAAEIAESILDSAPNVEACRLLVVANARLGSREKTLERLAALPEAFVLDRPEAYFLLADHQIAAQRYDDAHATIARFRESHPAHAAAFDYLEARESLVRGEAATAIEQFKILGEKAPQMQPVRLQLSIAYAQAGQLELARQTLEVYRTAYPADEDGIALWNSMFGESSSESLQAKAGALLGDANANAATMVETANLMLNREHPEGADKRDALAKSLLEESYKKAGSDALPFSALFEFYITRKDLAAADALLTQGEQNGVAAFALSRARAQRALADNDVQTAKSFLMADLDRADITGREVGEWAGLFSRAAYTEIGIEILETFAARAPDAAGKADREIEKIDFVLRSGDAAKALELARELAPSFNGLPGAIERLADAQMRAVEGLIRKGDVNSVALAQAAVHDALERNPEDTRAQENAVRLMLLPAKTDWSTFERADRLCATLRAKLPNDAAVLALSSEVARRSGQKARALEYASKAVKLAGTAPEPLMALARAQIASGLHNDAATTLNQTLALNPRDLNAQVLLVQAFGGARRFHEAEQVVEGLTAGMPATPERDTMLDSLRLSLANSRKDWPTVERLARSLSATDTTNFDFVMLLVRALAEQGRRTEGEEVLSRAAAETNTPRSWTDAGNYFMSRGQGRDDFAQASTMFTRAIMLSPNYPPALLGQIDIQGRTADISAALGLCDRYIAQSPDDSSILLAKAKLLSALPDRTQDALAAADDVIERVEDP